MSEPDPVLLLVAAVDRQTLVADLQRLRNSPPATLRDALAAVSDFPRGRERVAIVAEAADVPAALDVALERLPSLAKSRLVVRARGLSFSSGAAPGRVAFLFPGQGSEDAGMLRALRARLPLVGEWFDALDDAAQSCGEPPLTSLIDPPEAGAAAARHRRPLTDRERSAQLGTVADLALHGVLTRLGIVADVHVGHSNGEHPAVIAAGRVDASREELCRSFVRIGLTSARLARPDRERLLSVSAVDRARVFERLREDEGRVFLAMDNCPSQLVVGGEIEAVNRVGEDVSRWGGIAVALPFSRAYHTPLFADQAETFADYYREWRLRPGHVTVHSCHDTEALPDDTDLCRRAMVAQWTTLVRFSDTIRRLYDDGVRVFVEVGPDSKLTAFVEDILRGRTHTATSMTAINRSDVAQLCHLLADVFTAGITVDPRRLAELLDLQPQPGTTSPWMAAAAVHQRLSQDAGARLTRAGARLAGLDRPPAPRAARPLLGRVTTRSTGSLHAERRFTRRDDVFVDDHALGRSRGVHAGTGYPLPVLPFTLTLEIAAEAAAEVAGTTPAELMDVRASRWLALDRGAIDLAVHASDEGGDIRIRVNEVVQPNHESGRPARSAAFDVRARVAGGGETPAAIEPDATAGRPRHWTAERFYRDFAFHGPAFQRVTRVRAVGSRGIDAELTIAELPGISARDCVLDPAMLDCAGQLVAFWLLEHEGRPPTFGVFPFATRRVIVHQRPAPDGDTVRCRGDVTRRGMITDASFVFEAHDGSPIVSVQGFAQRLVSFPDWLAYRVFAGERVVLPSRCSADEAEILSASWGIWARALAHLTLSPERLDEWYQLPGPANDRLDWLLQHADR